MLPFKFGLRVRHASSISVFMLERLLPHVHFLANWLVFPNTVTYMYIHIISAMDKFKVDRLGLFKPILFYSSYVYALVIYP